MGKLGRLLVGSAVIGAAAAGAYEYLKENGKIPGVAGDKAAEQPETAAPVEPEAAPAEEAVNEEAGAEETAEAAETAADGADAAETAETADAADEDKRSDVEKAVDDFAQDAWSFAKRTYTTVKVGANDLKGKVDTNVVPKVKDAIGPKGSEILSAVGESAVKFKDVTVDSAKRIHEIIKEDTEKHYSTVESSQAEEAPAEDAEPQEAAEEPAVEEAAEEVSAEAEAAEEAPAEEAEEPAAEAAAEEATAEE